MRKILILVAALLLLPFTLSIKAQDFKPPVSFSMGQDLKTDNLIVVVGYDITIKKVVSADSSVAGQLVFGPTVLYSESDGVEWEGYGVATAYDFPLVWKIRTELGAALYTLPAPGDNPEWFFIGGALAFAPNGALRIKLGADYIRKSSGNSGPWVYGNLSLRIAQ